MQYVLGNMLNGGGINPDGLSLDLQFAADKTLTARRGPTPVFSRASSGTFVNANKIIVGKTAGTTSSITPSTQAISSQVTVTVASGSVVGWVVGQAISLIVDTDGQDDPDATELWLLGNIVSSTDTTLVFTVTSRTAQAGSATSWTLGYRGPRFDHDPVTGACKGLLIEEGRTNLQTNSQTFASWSTTDLTVAASVINDPMGQLARILTEGSAAASSHRVFQDITATSGTTYSVSYYVKAGTRTWCGIVGQGAAFTAAAYFNLATGALGSGSGAGYVNHLIQPLLNGWYRVTLVATAQATGAASLSLRLTTGDNTPTHNGDGVSFLYASMAQLEAGSFPTSYIPTTTGSVVRSADVCNITGGDFNNFYNQSEGTLFAECQTPSANQYAGIAVIGTTSFNHNIALFKSDTTGGTVGNRFVPYVTQGGTLMAIHDFGNESGNGNLKVLASVALNNMIFARNGTLSPLDSTAAMPTPNRITIGGRADGNYINGHIAAIRYFKKRLPNAKLVTLTT